MRPNPQETTFFVHYIRNESRGDKNSNLSLHEYFNKIKPYLWDIVIDLQSFNT